MAVKKSILLPVAAMLASICLVCCNARKFETRGELIDYLNNGQNGLIKKQLINEIQVVLKYQPWQLLAANLSDSQKKTRAAISKNMQDKYFFILSYSKNNKELLRQLDFNTYSEMVRVFSFRMLPYISLIPDRKAALPPDDCIFQPTYGMSDANNLLLVFNKQNAKGADEIKIRINEFGLGTGNIDFSLKTKDIDQIQDIDYKKF